MDTDHSMSVATAVFWSHTKDSASLHPPQPGASNSFTLWAPKKRKPSRAVGVPTVLVHCIPSFILPFHFLYYDAWMSGALLTSQGRPVPRGACHMQTNPSRADTPTIFFKGLLHARSLFLITLGASTRQPAVAPAPQNSLGCFS